jgi:protein CpxP
MHTRILTLALGGFLSLGIAGAALAQETAPPPQNQEQGGRGGHHQMDPDRQLKHLTRELGLSPDQQGQIKPILADRQQKMQALMQDQSLSGEDRRSRFQAIRQDSQSRIEAVLNDQQKQKFEFMPARRHGNGPGSQSAPQEGAPQPQ